MAIFHCKRRPVHCRGRRRGAAAAAVALLWLAPAAMAQDAVQSTDSAEQSTEPLTTIANVGQDLRMAPAITSEDPGALQPAMQAVDAPKQAPAADDGNDPVIKLGPGDAVMVQVYGRPEMSVTTYVADDGSIKVPLAGPVQVGGLAPNQAAEQVAAALRNGQYLLNPQVTVTISQFRSQQISVLGEVRTPGRYSLEARTSIIDLLAQAGGETENGADVIYVLRPHDGGTDRLAVDLRSLRDNHSPLPSLALKGGDSVFIPKADHFYIYGEVRQPNAYRLEPGMTVVQALSRSGGVTDRGSERRVVITRQTADGRRQTIDARPFDRIQADDVIRVKERIF